MRRNALVLGSFICVVAMIGGAAPATAAPLLSVSYDVTGGDMASPSWTGPVNGGSVAVTLPGSSTSTPVYCTFGSCGVANVLLTGSEFTGSPAFASFNSAPMFYLRVGPSYAKGAFTHMFVNGAYLYQTFGTFSYKYSLMGGAGAITGYVIAQPSINFAVIFTIGNEVRTFAATPTPTPPTPTPPTPTPPTPTPPTATPPTPTPAVSTALFRVLRSKHGHEPPMFTSSFTVSHSEPNPGAPGSYPPAVGNVTSMGGFTIPRRVIHFGTAAYDDYTAECGAPPFTVTCRPGYPISIYYYHYYNYKGIFRPNNPHAATATTTINRSVSSPSFTTTAFGNNYAFGRQGMIKITPGPKRFGGTMRYFGGSNAFWYQFVSVSTPCCSKGYGYNFRTGTGPYGSPTGSLGFTENSPQVVGGTHPGKRMKREHTYLTTGFGGPLTRMVQLIRTTAPWTTGRVSVVQTAGAYATTLVKSGYDNRTTNGSLGTLSLVVPWLTHQYETPWSPPDPITAFQHYAGIQTMRVNFLPEPAGIIMLGAGVIGLAGIYRLRKR